MISKLIRKFCKNPEKIENYDKAISDTTQTWHCHHRLELYTPSGEKRPKDLYPRELIALGMYYDRPPEELIFLTPSDHMSLHRKSRKADIVYFCYYGELYIDKQATITELTAELCSLVGYKYKAMIRQRLKDTKKLVEANAGLEQYAEFQLTKERANKLRYYLDLEDDELITEDNKIIITISNEERSLI